MKKIILLVMLVACLAVQANAEKILSIGVAVLKDDSISIDLLKLEDNYPSRFDYGQSGDYALKITDKSGNVVYSTVLPVTFSLYSDPPVPRNEAHVLARIPYKPEMTRVEIYKKDKMLLSREIDLCNKNGYCDIDRESTMSCPADCAPGSKDGLCIKDADGVCDPDCIPGADPDCAAKDIKYVRWSLWNESDLSTEDSKEKPITTAPVQRKDVKSRIDYTLYFAAGVMVLLVVVLIYRKKASPSDGRK